MLVNCNKTFEFPSFSKALFILDISNIAGLLLNLSPEIISAFGLFPLSRFFVQCRVSLENSGRISLLECYRTAASVCWKHLYPKEYSFKNRTSWNKAGLSYIFLFTCFLSFSSFPSFLHGHKIISGKSVSLHAFIQNILKDKMPDIFLNKANNQ